MHAPDMPRLRPMIETLAEVLFGRDGNAGPCLLDGWSFPEDGFVWSVGAESRMQIPLRPVPPGSAPILELDVNPFIVPGRTAGQRLAVSVNGVRVGADSIERGGLVGYRIPPALLASGSALLIELHHPDAARPVDLGVNGDARRLGFMVHSAAVLAVGAEPDFRPRLLPPLDLPDTRDTEALKAATAAHIGQSADALMMNFESLGHNCEFGMMQKHCGADPIGLLRWVGIGLPDLLRGLDCGFAEIGDTRWLRVYLHDAPRPEFMVCDTRHNITSHSWAFEDESTAERVRTEQGRQLKFRHKKFMEILQTGEKLFVFQQPGRLLAAHMLPLLTQLRKHGPNVLLFVTEGDEHPSGTVVQIGDGLYHGFIGALAPGEDVGSGDLRAWLSICANAYALWREQDKKEAVLF